MDREEKNIEGSPSKHEKLTNANESTVLTETAIAEFTELFKKRFHRDLSREEAFARANRVLNMYRVVYRRSIKK